jgi:sequestosome 1
MASTYYVKVYYTKQQQQQPEIRRFAIDTSPDNNIYQELCTKIATYQPDIQLNGFTLQYIDEENEHITFSSSEELRSAISSNKDSNAFKVFVVTNHQQETTNKECHTGVECDGCKGSVIGSRYKCVICPNYDLCEKCSSAGVHSEHNMIKISKPGNLYHPYGARHHGGGGGRRFRHIPPSPFAPNPEFIEQIQAQIPQWLPNRENTAHFRTHVQSHIENIKSNTQTHMQNSKQYLESVGQYLQQALSPFGIDCDYRVDGQTQETSTNENPTPPEPSAVPKNAEETSNSGGVSSWLNMFRTAGTNSTTTATATQATASSDTSQPSEKAVEECVEKMKAMGFNEANEDLMELIRLKKGDLNSVLDEISTRYQQT